MKRLTLLLIIAGGLFACHRPAKHKAVVETIRVEETVNSPEPPDNTLLAPFIDDGYGLNSVFYNDVHSNGDTSDILLILEDADVVENLKKGHPVRPFVIKILSRDTNGKIRLIASNAHALPSPTLNKLQGDSLLEEPMTSVDHNAFIIYSETDINKPLARRLRFSMLFEQGQWRLSHLEAVNFKNGKRGSRQFLSNIELNGLLFKDFDINNLDKLPPGDGPIY